MAGELKPSGIRAVFERALELEREGRSIVHLEIGRPHCDSPEAAKRAATEALDRGAVHYTSNRGLPELREEVAAYVARRGGGSYDAAAEVVVTAGGSEAVATAFHALLERGERAIVPTPAWPHYVPLLSLAGAEGVELPCPATGGFVPDPEAVARVAADTGARLLVVSSPSNPTGVALPRPTLEALAEVCVEHDLWVLSDEIYERFVYGGAEHVSIATLPGMRERTVVVNSFSKSWSMTGWRVGWALAPAAIAARLNTVHQYLTVCAPSFAQWGAIAALQGGEDFVAGMHAEYDARRRELVAGLAGTRAELADPSGAFYAFPRIPGADGTELSLALLEDAGVAVVPGGVFGAGYEDCLRISYAVTAEQLAAGVERMRPLLA